tara:strand:+ start:22980 stop:23711 length:732 start_codon:yes stop_codon:yes gene_type:complete
VAHFVGVDGCKGGWFAVWQARTGIKDDFGTGIHSQIYSSIVDLWQEHSDAVRILIDIPIGLKESEDRGLEKQVRKLLGPRRSSVFPVPCVAAAYAQDYIAASALNRQNIGKGLSKQAWFITPLIRDVDQFLQHSSTARMVLGECHPELAFATLNGAPLPDSKKTTNGQTQRHDLIQDHFPQLDQFLEGCLAQHRRATLKLDDCLDALVLLVTARTGRKLNVQPEEGVGGVPIDMWIPDIPGYY